MENKIKKAVFPVAGMGTRFLPATKANPKEMLPVVDKPLIQYAVEEAIEAGVTELIFVTSSTKRAIEDHFDKNYALESELEKHNKQELLDVVRSILPKGVNCVYIRQPEALGLGHAVLCAKSVVGRNPFAVILADDLIGGDSRGTMSQMAEVYAQYGSSVLGVEQVEKSETNKYGIVSSSPFSRKLTQVNGIVEKPHPDEAPSTLAVVGRYILTPRIFHLLQGIGKGAGGEIQLTDGIARLLDDEHVLAYEFDGVRHDCGSKLGYLQATVEYGIKHPTLGSDFSEYLKRLSL